MRSIGLAAIAAAVLFLVPVTPVHAIIFYSTADANHNTTAPTGGYADSGWQWQGNWGSGSGTAISSKHFITSKHFLKNPTEDSTFVVNDSTFHYSTHVNDLSSDLRIVTIQETFSSWAPLYTNSNENGKELVVFGRGYTRGDEVKVGDVLKGWKWSSTGNGTRRWGTNDVSGFANGGALLKAEFNADGGANEAHLARWDSGGGVFIKDGDIWKLAGVNRAVDGYFNSTPSDTGRYNAALFDMGGLYVGSGDNWTFIEDETLDKPSSFYATRISSQLTWINDNIPEPGTMILLTLGAIGLLHRRRKA